MKRCPECGREYDNTMAFCLDDGVELLYGPASADEPATAILSGGRVSSEQATRTFGKGSVAGESTLIGTDQTNSKKNSIMVVAFGIVLVAVLGIGGYVYYGRGSSKQIESIAVMPFVNESGNTDVEYLSDGLTETLIGSLSKLSDLSVKSRSAVFAYKGQQLSAKQIGDELGVQAVLLGRLVQRGEIIKVNLELVNARTQDVIWSEQYDRKPADLVNLQSEIARDVSSRLRAKLSGQDQQALNKRYTDDPEAYRLYLQGRFYLNKRVGKEYEKAEGFLRQAIELDPNFALGYIGLAEFVGQRDRPRAKDYVARALAIDNQLSQAHALLGFQVALDRDWATAERELTRALELDPNSWQAHQWNGARLMMIGSYDECLRSFDRAIALEPTIPDLRNNRGSCLVAAGRIEEGIASIKTAMDVDPGYPWSYSHVSFVYRMTGDRAASVEARARSIELLDRPDLGKRLRGAFAGGHWTNYLRELLSQTKDNFQSPVRRASIQAELGQREEAIASLQEAAEKGDWWLFSIKYDPAFEPLRNDPAFQAILRQFDPPR